MYGFIIILVASVYLEQDLGHLAETWFPTLDTATRFWTSLGMYGGVFLAGVAWLTVSTSRLSRPQGWRWIALAESGFRVFTWVLLMTHVFCVFGLGWGDSIRSGIGNLVLLDEMIAILPALSAMIGWWAFRYPIHQRIRESLLIRHLDQGDPLYQSQTRAQFVLNLVRIHLVLILVPIVMIMTWNEAVQILWPKWVNTEVVDERWQFAAMFSGTAVVLGIAPLVVRRLWKTSPLRDGPLRERLGSMCTTHRVKIRELLVWDTGGEMANAAVMGFVPQLRYVLLSDALLDGMNDTDVEAVMAHEIGHIRRRHLPWLAVGLLSGLGAMGILVTPLVSGVVTWLNGKVEPPVPETMLERMVMAMNPGLLPPEPHPFSIWVEPIGALVTLVGALCVFGWISRRFERQADTFAVQHLARHHDEGGENATRVTPHAIGGMLNALSTVAHLNHIPIRRRTWRHGSIAWRQDHLRSLEGQPLDGLAIDRTVVLIKAISAIVLAAVVAHSFWMFSG